MARASPARFRMPPDSAAGILSKSAASPTRASFSRAVAWTSRSPSLAWRRRTNATFSPTLIESNSAPFWNTNPIRRRTWFNSALPRAVMSVPST